MIKAGSRETYRREAEALRGRLVLLDQWHRRHETAGDSGRSFIIEFAGMPKAGKSTAVQDLRHYFSHGDGTQRKIYTPAEGVSHRTPSLLRKSKLDFNSWAGAYAVQELLVACHDTHHDLSILDRGPWDAGCWLDFWMQDPTSGADPSTAAIVQFFQLETWMTRADLHIVLVVDPATAGERERDSRLIEHRGFASELDQMTRLKQIYESRFANLRGVKSKACRHVGERGAILLDTTDMLQEEVALRVITAAMDVLEAKLGQNSADFEFDVGWVLQHVDGYLSKSRNARKGVLQYLPAFVERANTLPARQRLWLMEQIKDSSAPEYFLANRASRPSEALDPVSRDLERLLLEASKR